MKFHSPLFPRSLAPPRIDGGHGVVIKGIVENNKMKINSASSRAAAVMHRRVQYA